jgi:muramidase (phage lysozyme)
MKNIKRFATIPLFSGTILLVSFGGLFNSFQAGEENANSNSNRHNPGSFLSGLADETTIESAGEEPGSNRSSSERESETVSITESTQTEEVDKWAIIRAFIRTIYCAEGTYDCYPDRDNHYRTRGIGNPDGISGYHLLFGGDTVDDLSRHPDICIPFNWNGRQDCSTAAGAAQWLTTTWENNLENCPLAVDQSFEPYNQDLVLLCLLNNIGVLDINYSKTPAVISSDSLLFAAVKSIDGFRDLSDRTLSRKWASFPCFTGTDHFGSQCNGTSYYSQGGKTIEELWEIYNRELEMEMRDNE